MRQPAFALLLFRLQRQFTQQQLPDVTFVKAELRPKFNVLKVQNLREPAAQLFVEEPSKVNSASSTNGWPIFADLWNSEADKKFPLKNAILLTDLALEHLPHLQKLSNYTKVNEHFQLLKMDLNHKNMPLSWVLILLYIFDRKIPP